MNDKWKLHHGVHRGTLTSRDSAVSYFDTEQEARDSFTKQKALYQRVGYSIWFAHLMAPDGRKITIDVGVPYW